MADNPAPRRVSSGGTFFYKRIMPVFVLVTVAGPVAFAVAVEQDPAARTLGAVVGLLTMTVFAVVYRFLVLDLADEVWDEGEGLRVRRGQQTVRIPLHNVREIKETMHVNPKRVTLRVSGTAAWNGKVVFTPRMEGLSSRSGYAKELRERVEEARRAR